MQSSQNLNKAILSCFVGQLPEEDRLVLGLHYLEHLTFEEIASILGLPISDVAVIYSKAVNTCLNLEQSSSLIPC